MKIKQSILLIILSIFFISCDKEIALLNQLDTDKDVKFYFMSSEIMGPNNPHELSNFQNKNHSFYIDDKGTIEKIKETWVYNSTSSFDNFTADYFITYTEDGEYKGKISIDLENNIAISGYGPTNFDKEQLFGLDKFIKPLYTKFFNFENLEEARIFYNRIKDKKWLLPSPNDKEYYKWTEYEGECIVKVNNQKFARDKDINKAFKKYMPKKFSDIDIYYNIFRFTSQNSTIRICSNSDISNEFPEEFHVIIPWQKYNNIILPLVNFNNTELEQIINTENLSKFTIIDKIE